MWQLVMNGGNTVSVNFGYWKYWKMLAKNACKKIEDLIVKILKEFNYFGHDWASMLHIEFKSVTDTKLLEVISLADNPLLPSIRRRETATFDRSKDNKSCIATEFDSGFINTPNSIQVPSHFTEAGTVYFSELQTIRRMLKCFKSLALTLKYEYPVNEHLAESISPNLLYHSSNFEAADVSLHDQQSQKARGKVFTEFSKSNQQTLDVDLEPSKDQETAVAESLTSMQSFWDCIKYTQPRHRVPTSTYVSTSKSLRPRSLLSSCASILLFSMLIFTMPPAISGFSEIPTSQVVSAGEEAGFMCQYNGASFIGWTVNGSYNYPPGSSTEGRPTDDGLLSILTIPALPEYNGTLVQCVATIFNGTSSSVFTSPTAVLLVISYTTPSPPTTPPPPTNNGFIFSPEDQTVPEDTMSEFRCQHNATAVTWRVNGKRVVGNVTHVLSFANGNIHILSISAKPEFNNSVVECEALGLGQRRTALLQVQGTLELSSGVRIVRHTNGTYTASWGEAASLNITNVEPDVLYEVALYQLASACGDRYQLINTSTTFETQYTFDQPYFPYELRVTPRNNVEGAKNGSSKSLSVTDYIRFTETTVGIIDMPKDNVSVVLYPKPKMYELPGITPASFSVSLQTFDDEEEEIDEPDCPCLFDNTESKLTIKHQLRSQRLWNYHVFAGNCTNDALSSSEILSTHYVQNITANSTQPGQIQFCGDFVANSTAKGFLVIANNSNVFHSIVLYREMIERNACRILGGLSSGTYNYSVFTLDENGLPITRSAYVSKHVDVESDNMTEDVIIDSTENISAVTIDNSNCTGVFIRCTIKDDSADSCVAVVYKKVTTSPYGLLNIDVQHLIGREGVASGCVKNVTFDIQNVLIFSYSNSSGLIGKKAVTLVPSDKTVVSSSSLAVVLSVVLMTITVILLIVLIAVVIIMRSMCRKSITVVTESGEHSNVYSSTPKLSRTHIQLPESTPPPSASWINTLGSQTPLISPTNQRIQSDGENCSFVLPTSQRIQSDGESCYTGVPSKPVEIIHDTVVYKKISPSPFRKEEDLLNEEKPPALPPKPLVPFAQDTKTDIPCEESQQSLVSEKVAHGKVLNTLPTTVPTTKPHNKMVVSCEESQQLSEISSESEVILNKDSRKELNNSHNAQAEEDSGVSEDNSASNSSDAGIENGEVSINIDDEELSDYHNKNKRFSDGEDCESGTADQNDDIGGKVEIRGAVNVFEYLGNTNEDYRPLNKLMSQDENEKPECDLVQIGSLKPISTASQEPIDNYMSIIARQFANNANQSQSKPLQKVQTPNSGKELFTLECHQFETHNTEESSDLKIRLRVDKFVKKRGDIYCT